MLQAADILLYDADEVPVGEDQKQHVELARDIAQRFNHLYGEIFVLPEPVIPEVGARVMGLDDPTAKMSKSRADRQRPRGPLLDEPDEIERADQAGGHRLGPRDSLLGRPGAGGGERTCSASIRRSPERRRAEVEADFAAARGYGDLKRAVAEVVVTALAPIRERYVALMQRPGRARPAARAGRGAARAVAEPKIAEAKRRMGLLLPA